ncbi:MAG: uncharacterized protein JWM42_2928 [Burkholderia sp.]|nr:uncharacterized protein [Burkholderia sp.]
MTQLRQQMQADMVVRGLAPRTQRAYIDAVAAIARYYGRSPDQLSCDEIEQYLHHLIEERKRSRSTTNQAVCALRFLFHITLKQPSMSLAIPYRRIGSKQPHILSRDEVARILTAAGKLTHRTILMTTYAAGLRVAEVCSLRVSDIDSERMMLRVCCGKGAKDRYTLLSAQLLETLRRYWYSERPALWLFPKASNPHALINVCNVQCMFYRAKHAAGITKQGGIHSLRHAFATHLLESGVDVHTIQRLLGHSQSSTTAHYFHLQQQRLTSTSSLLDLLPNVAPLQQ